MKSVISALVLALASVSASAQAATVLVSRASPQDVAYNYASFDINAPMSRAWVVVKYWERDSGSDRGSDETIHRSLVPGLSYDANAKQIVFAGKSGNVVCANVTFKTGLLGRVRYSISTTGACTFETSVATQTRDSGFDVESTQTLDTYLNIAE
jgi:hypothetical protein